MQTIRSLPGASVGHVAVDLLGRRVTLDRLAFGAPDRRVSIGRIEVPLRSAPDIGLIPRAFAQSDAVDADAIKIELGKVVFSIPHLKAMGTALSAADLAGIFDAKQPGTLEDRLAKLSAQTLSAPELTIGPADAEAAAKNGVFTVRNIVLSDVSSGKIKALSADGASVVGGTAPDTTGTFDIGKIAAAGLDVPLAVRIIDGSRSDEGMPLAPLYDSFSIASVKFSETAPDVQTFEIGTIEGSGLKGRPLLVPIRDYTERLDKAKADTTSDDERQHTVALTIDALKSVSIGHLALRDIAFAKPGSDKPVSLKLASMSLEASEVLRIGLFAVENLVMATPDANLSLARFAVEGLDQSGLTDALKQDGSILGPDASLAELQSLTPKLSKISLATMHVEVPAKTLDGNSADGSLYLFDVPAVELKVGSYAGHMATDATSLVHVIYDVSPTAPNPGLQALAQSGFGHLDVTADTALKWNPDSRNFKFDRLAFAAKDLATLVLSGALSSVSPDVFGTDEAARAAAAQQVKVDAFEVGFTNLGMIDKVLPILAARSGMTVTDFKTDLKLKLHQMVLETLGEGEAALQIVRAGSAFIDTPKSFDLKLAAPHGLGMQDVAGAAEPKDLLGLVTITATANQ